MTNSFEMLQPPEPEVMEALMTFWAKCRHFVDIGASYGEFTTAAISAMRSGKIDAIEPDISRISSLNSLVARHPNNQRIEVEIHHCAIGNRNERIVFQKPASENVSGRIAGVESHKTQAGTPMPTNTTYIQAKTLDELFSGTPPDLIKMDIEGAEGNALLGAREILRSRRTVWVIELHDYSGGWTPLQVTQHMQLHGYRTNLLMPARYLFTPDTLLSRPLYYAKKLAAKIRRAT